jgi:glutamate/tyrosine decarboxylase-like PLP-dependent enzyme
MSLQVFGAAAFREAQERGFALAEAAEAQVRALPGWEVVTPAQMGVVTFRCAPPGLAAADADRLNRRLVAAMIADGSALVTSTVLRGRAVLRICTMNPRTTEAEVRATVRRLDALVAGLTIL